MPIGWGNSSTYSTTTSGYGAAGSWFTAESIGALTPDALASTSYGAILAYLAAVLIVIVIILVFIHYTLYPIFQLNPGGAGWIPIPGFNDSKVYWQPTSTVKTFSDISDTSTIIGTASDKYSLTVDLVIQNPYTENAGGNGYRVLFSRGGTKISNPVANSTIKGTINNYGLVMALAPKTTDLIVSMLNSAGNEENILISNVPIQTPFRVGVVVFGNAFEVYLNGKLINTRIVATGSVSTNTGAFQGPDATLNMARIGNLILWDRIAAAAEIHYAKPPLMSAIADDVVPVSASCYS